VGQQRAEKLEKRKRLGLVLKLDMHSKRKDFQTEISSCRNAEAELRSTSGSKGEGEQLRTSLEGEIRESLCGVTAGRSIPNETKKKKKHY
jgi:hypothetical protein